MPGNQEQSLSQARGGEQEQPEDQVSGHSSCVYVGYKTIELEVDRVRGEEATGGKSKKGGKEEVWVT